MPLWRPAGPTFYLPPGRAAFKLKKGLTAATLTPVHCNNAALYGHLIINGVHVRGMLDTGASVSCIGYDLYLQHQQAWGPLDP